MDVQAIDTAVLVSDISRQGPLFSFMLFVILVLLLAVRTLYQRNVKQGDDQNNSQRDGIVALTNNTNSLEAVADSVKDLSVKVDRLIERSGK